MAFKTNTEHDYFFDFLQLLSPRYSTWWLCTLPNINPKAVIRVSFLILAAFVISSHLFFSQYRSPHCWKTCSVWLRNCTAHQCFFRFQGVHSSLARLPALNTGNSEQIAVPTISVFAVHRVSNDIEPASLHLFLPQSLRFQLIACLLFLPECFASSRTASLVHGPKCLPIALTPATISYLLLPPNFLNSSSPTLWHCGKPQC